MIVFVVIASLLTLAVIALLVRPLLWPRAQSELSQQKLNAEIYREQAQALERDRAAGNLSQAEFEAASDELALRLLDDEQGASAEPASIPNAASGRPGAARRTATVIAVLLPMAAAGLYMTLGAPHAIDPVAAQREQDDQVTRMVENLAAKMKANPDNPKGWAMLGRSYKVLGRLKDSAEAYAKAGPLLETDPDVMAHYADVLAVLNGNAIKGAPLELIEKALKIDPQHPMSLMLAGSAAYVESDFKKAVALWERLLTQVEPGSPDAEQVENNIADARAKGGLPASTPGRPAAGAGAAAAAAPKPALAGASGEAAAGGAPVDPAVMVARLAARLKDNPGDTAGWARLARSYKVMGKPTEAMAAYEKAGKLLETDADIMTDYADLLATGANGSLEGKPLALINKALALNPKHAMARMLAGTAAFQRSDYKGAISHWEVLRTVFMPGSPDAEWAERNIREARAKAGMPPERK